MMSDAITPYKILRSVELKPPRLLNYKSLMTKGVKLLDIILISAPMINIFIYAPPPVLALIMISKVASSVFFITSTRVYFGLALMYRMNPVHSASPASTIKHVSMHSLVFL